MPILERFFNDIPRALRLSAVFDSDGRKYSARFTKLHADDRVWTIEREITGGYFVQLMSGWISPPEDADLPQHAFWAPTLKDAEKRVRTARQCGCVQCQ